MVSEVGPGECGEGGGACGRRGPAAGACPHVVLDVLDYFFHLGRRLGAVVREGAVAVARKRGFPFEIMSATCGSPPPGPGTPSSGPRTPPAREKIKIYFDILCISHHLVTSPGGGITVTRPGRARGEDNGRGQAGGVICVCKEGCGRGHGPGRAEGGGSGERKWFLAAGVVVVVRW